MHIQTHAHDNCVREEMHLIICKYSLHTCMAIDMEVTKSMRNAQATKARAEVLALNLTTVYIPYHNLPYST